MNIIRAAEAQDLAAIANTHKEVLADTNSSRIGFWFLKMLYETLIKNPTEAKVYVAEDDGKITGFISLCHDYTGLNKRINERITITDVMRVILRAIFRPMLAKDIFLEKLFTRFLETQPKPFPVILTLGVLPNQRGSGLAAQLMNTAIQELLQSGHRTIFLDTDVDNIRAQNFYKKYGFVMYGKKYGNMLFRYTQ